MEIAITVLLLIVGLVLIIKGGDFFVDAASWMAEASGIPKLIVGATVVSFATTLPELLVSIFAALDARAAEALSPGSGIGMVDMSIGNAIGSVTANLGLIMGIALVAIPMAIRRKDYMLKMILMLVAAAVTVCFSLFDNGVGMVASILLIIIFVIAMYDNIHEAVVAVKGGAKGQQLDEPVTKKAVITNVVKFLIGAVGTVAGAQLLVDNGSALASMCGVSDRVISVTIIGTCYQAACLFGLVKSGGDISFVFKNDTIFVFGVVIPSALIAMWLGAPPWVVFACLKCDQILKCFVAVVKINRFNWMKNLTRDTQKTLEEHG